MKQKWMIPVFVLIVIWMQLLTVYAQSRSIYIGDNISFEISDQSLSEKEIKEAFEGFDLVNVAETETGIHVTVRPETVGEKEIHLSNQTLIVDVKSTLDEIDRDDIFEKDIETGLLIENNILYGIMGGSAFVLALTCGIWLIKKSRKERQVVVSPYDVFMKVVLVKEVDKQTLSNITKASKQYLSEKLDWQLVGYTTSQLEAERYRGRFNDIIDPVLLEKYLDWLKVCDNEKFSSQTILISTIIDLKKELEEIVSAMEIYFIDKEQGSVMEDAV